MDYRIFTRTLAAALLIALISTAAHAQGGPKSTRIVVFGDSLSDTGRADILSTALHENLDPAIPVIPGPHYFEGRFSNGPVWVEHLADTLGLPRPRPVNEGGTNFAVGGALTETVLDESVGVPVSPHPAIVQMDEQVDQYIATTNRGSAKWNVFVVWGGANDLLFPFTQAPWFDPEGGWPLPPDSTAAAQNVADQVRALHAHGARNFIVPNLPRLGATLPLGRFLPPEVAEMLDDLTDAFNRELAAALDEIEQEHSRIRILRLDVAGLVEEIFADPSAFGLGSAHIGDFAAAIIVGEDEQGPILAPLEPGVPEDFDLVVHPDADAFMFWDPVHISATTHRIVADRVFQTLAGELLAELATD